MCTDARARAVSPTQYASLSLENRLRAPSSASAAFEQHQIPSDLGGLRSAIGAVKQQQREGLRPVMLGGPGTNTIHLAHVVAAHHEPSTPLNGESAGGGPAIQAELARLRFQVDHLKEVCNLAVSAHICPHLPFPGLR